MAYIPKDAKWYLADIVEELKVEGSATSVVHINLMLIRADSPEQAYKRALKVGRWSNITYENVDGKTVVVTFRGLKDLNVIYDEMEHGSELAFDKREDLTEAEIQQLVRPKAALNVFLPNGGDEANLDYMPEDIYRAVNEEVQRRNSVQTVKLRKMKDKRFNHWVKRLEHCKFKKRLKAVKKLGKCRDARAIPYLIHLYEDKDRLYSGGWHHYGNELLFNYIVDKALAHFGEQGLLAVIQALQPNPDVSPEIDAWRRSWLVYAIVEFNDLRVLTAIAACLNKNEPPLVYQWAIRAVSLYFGAYHHFDMKTLRGVMLPPLLALQAELSAEEQADTDIVSVVGKLQQQDS